MADNIQFGYVTGKTLTYGAYQPDGTVRTAAGTSLTEVAGTGYYKATDASVVAGDAIIVKDGTVVVGAGEYLPAVTATGTVPGLAALEAKVDIIDTNVDTIETSVGTISTNLDTLIVDQNKVLNVVEDTTKKESFQVTIG